MRGWRSLKPSVRESPMGRKRTSGSKGRASRGAAGAPLVVGGATPLPDGASASASAAGRVGRVAMVHAVVGDNPEAVAEGRELLEPGFAAGAVAVEEDEGLAAPFFLVVDVRTADLDP